MSDLKKFRHCPIVLPELVTETSPDGFRVYKTPEGNIYPSITTVLAADKENSIEKWRKRVGHEEAELIRFQAAGRGTDVHAALENYVNNNHEFLEGLPTLDFHAFSQIKPILDANLDDILIQEAPLYSHYLKTAGRTDIIGHWKGKRAVIDFKTSRKLKKEKWIKSYFQQGAGYAVMFEERTGMPINLVVIVIYVDHEDPQIFEVQRDDHIFDFIKVREKFNAKMGF